MARRKSRCHNLASFTARKIIETLFARIFILRRVKSSLRKKRADCCAGRAADDDADRAGWYTESATHERARTDLFAFCAVTCQEG